MSGYLITQILYECSGCGACVSCCPQSCIILTSREDGFLYPKIDKSKCISCHKCEQTCPYGNPAVFQKPRQCLAVVAKDAKLVNKSSSGGVFGLIAGHVIKGGGVVFGATLDESFQCIHIGIEDEDSLWKIQKSKYVQSKTDMAFTEAQKYLQDGRTVLFAGTPCQVAGLMK